MDGDDRAAVSRRSRIRRTLLAAYTAALLTLQPRVLVVVGAMAVLPTAVPGRTYPPPPKAEQVISSGPMAWALATTAHLTYRNGWRIESRLDLLQSQRVKDIASISRNELSRWSR